MCVCVPPPLHHRPVPCPRECGASLWHQDLPEHVLVCPRRLLVCSRVPDSFEKDVLYAGRNGRSALELSTLVRDMAASQLDISSDSSSCDGDGDSDSGAAVGGTGGSRPVRRGRGPPPLTPDEQEMVRGMTVEERFAFDVARAKQRAKDALVSSAPSTQLTHCFKASPPPPFVQHPYTPTSPRTPALAPAGTDGLGGDPAVDRAVPGR